MCRMICRGALGKVVPAEDGTYSLERLKPFHEFLVLSPSDACGACRRRIDGRQAGKYRSLFRAEGDFGVAICGIETNVAEPAPNHVDVGARLQQRDRSTVPEYVRRYSVALAVAPNRSKHRRVPHDDLVDAESRQWLPVMRGEQGKRLIPPCNGIELFQQRCGFRPDRT